MATEGALIPDSELPKEPIAPVFVPEFDLSHLDEIATIDLIEPAPEPAPRCRHYLPHGYFNDLVLCRTTADGHRGESVRVIVPTTQPVPREQWHAAIQRSALIRASGTECYPNGHCNRWAGWALVEGGRIVAKDEWWVEKCSSRLAAIFGSGGGSINIEVYAGASIREKPGLCPVCGEEAW